MVKWQQLLSNSKNENRQIDNVVRPMWATSQGPLPWKPIWLQ